MVDVDGRMVDDVDGRPCRYYVVTTNITTYSIFRCIARSTHFYNEQHLFINIQHSTTTLQFRSISYLKYIILSIDYRP